ncbi:MAG: hypothetical protein IPN40_06975 [Uliginosibacterium sp.]|nr:hypothetical protein [Uliginosibacterium sp.]
MYQKDERTLLELKEEDFDSPSSSPCTAPTVIGERGIYAGQMLESGVGVFRKYSGSGGVDREEHQLRRLGNPVPLARAVEGHSTACASGRPSSASRTAKPGHPDRCCLGLRRHRCGRYRRRVGFRRLPPALLV